MIISDSDFGPLKKVDKPEFQYHELCSALPEANDEDYESMLRVAKRLGGIHNDPGTVWEGMLLDGRNRMRACKELGFPFEYRDFLGNYEQARELVMAKNLSRRHLTTGQKAVSICSICIINKRRGFSETGNLVKDAVKLGLTPATARRGYELLSRGSSAEINKVLHGETSLHDALTNKKIDEKMGPLIGDGIAKEDELPDPDIESYTDSRGEDVPEELLEIWGGLKYFTTLKKMVDEILPELKRIINHPSGHAVSPEYYKVMTDLSLALENKQPGAACPHCRGTKKSHSALSIKRWQARGKEDCFDCYCCQGHGYLMRDEPWPDDEWINRAPF